MNVKYTSSVVDRQDNSKEISFEAKRVAAKEGLSFPNLSGFH
jgi:hypothetical protein